MKSIVVMCEKITRYCLYTLVVLTPLLFAPWTVDILEFNKQFLLVVLVFVALFAWMIRVLMQGSFKITLNKVNWMVLAVLLAFILSTIVSVSRYGSFWGWPQGGSESLLSVICFVILYFLVANTFAEKEIKKSLQLLGISAGLALLYGILQITGLHIFRFSFATSDSFNTIGQLGGLGFFAAVVLPLMIVLSIIDKTRWRFVFTADILLAFIIVLFINYNFVWILTFVGCGLLILVWVMRRDIFDGRLIALPVFFVMVSLFFLLFAPQIKWLPQISPEISLSNKTTFQVAGQALKAFPVFGSGPGTFAYDFGKYKSIDFNKTLFWNISFNAGSSKFFTAISELGVVGLLAWFALCVTVIFYGGWLLLFGKSAARAGEIPLLLALFSSVAVIIVGYFFHNSNISLDSLFFIFVACLVSLMFKEKKEYVLKPSALITFGVTAVFTLLFIFGAGIVLLEGQRYVAQIYYSKAVGEFSANKKDTAITDLKIAASNNTKLDIYFNQLAIFSLSSLQDKIAAITANSSAQDKSKAQTLLADSVSAATVATQLNPNSIEDWSTKGYVCQNLVGVATDAVTCAISSYDKALALNPSNPYLYLQEGNVYFAQALNTPDAQAQDKANAFLAAKDKFNKAIALKKDYALAYYQIALIDKNQHDSSDENSALAEAETYSVGDAPSLFQIGLVYYQDNNWNSAQQDFLKALALVPDYANALYYSGLTFDQMGQKQNALVQFQKLAKNNSNNSNVQKILANLQAGKPALDGLVPQTPTPVAPNPPSVKTPPTTNPKK